MLIALIVKERSLNQPKAYHISYCFNKILKLEEENH